MKGKSKGLPFSEDYIFMSYRYCIGRHTIAAHYHATTIAKDVYGKLSDGRMEFYSEDICSCIYDQLHFKDFIDFGWYGNIPKREFKPLSLQIVQKRRLKHSTKTPIIRGGIRITIQLKSGLSARN